MTLTELRDDHSTEWTEVSLSIGGMTCGACAARIESQLNALDGVEARVNLASERARVRLPAGTSPALIVERIESAGFSAEIAGSSSSAEEDKAEADRRVRYVGRRLVVAGLLFMPLSDASVAFWLVPSLRFPGWQWILLVLAAPILTWAAWPFYQAAIRNARHGIATMDTLVSVGIAAATAWSVYAMFFRDTSHVARTFRYVLAHQSSGAIYLDVAAGVTTFLLAGRYFEARSKRQTGSALRALSAVAAKDVAVLDAEDSEKRRPIGALREGDRFVVRPGETVATDGEVIFGHSAIDRSAMTGESVPADVTVGDSVIGGTVCVGGRLVVRATKLGADTQLAQMLRLVEDAQNQKADVQRLADRIAGVFVPAVIGIAPLHPDGMAASRGYERTGLQRSTLRADHRVSVRPRPGHPHGAHGRLGRRSSARHLLQGISGSRRVTRNRHGAPRQDRDRHRRGDGGGRDRQCRRRLVGGPAGMGGFAGAGIRTPCGQSNRQEGAQRRGRSVIGEGIRGTGGSWSSRLSRRPRTDGGTTRALLGFDALDDARVPGVTMR